MKLLWLVVLAVIILGCTKPIPLEQGPGTVKLNETNIRPDIPRVNPQINESEFIDAGEQPVGPKPFIEINKTPSVDLDVPLGDAMGKHHPLITSRQFPLLRHQSVRVTNNFLLGYEERLRFDFGINSSGKIVFGMDDDDNIGTFLQFEQDKPVFEYSAHLNKGTFEQVSGRDIMILGHTYTIAEATNFSVALFGKDVPYNLIFVDNQSLIANGSRQGGTVAHVRHDTISYTFFGRGKGRDDLLLKPGESIATELGNGKLASLLFDIRYLGAPLQNSTVIGFDRTKYGYKLHFETVEGKQELQLVEQDAGKLVLGNANERLRVTSCSYCIAEDDVMLLTAPDGRSFFMQYSGISNESKLLILRDLQGNRYDYKFIGNPGQDARTDIIIEKIRFPVRIGAIVNGTANLSVEQGFRSGRAELVTLGGFIIRIGDPTNTTLPLEIIIPATRTRTIEERTFVNITYSKESDSWTIGVGNITYIEDEETEDSFGTTAYGMAVLLDKNDRNLPVNLGDEATLLIPRSRTFGQVRLEG